MASLIKRYRELLFVAGLAAFSFLVFFAHAKKGGQLTFADRAVLWFTAPAERTVVAAVYGVVDGWNGYVWLRKTREDNFRLRREALQARAVAQQNDELKLENDRLRRLLDYADKQPQTRLLVAQVVAVGASPHSHTLRIARGSADGVVKGAVVISPDGIVGTVAQVMGGYSDVQLIVSPLSAVPAISQRTRSRSTIKGTGDLSRCKLEYALRTDDLQEGDVMITAGGSGYFPQGLRIGRVTSVAKQPHGLFLDAQVVPAVDFSRLDEVEVVLEEHRTTPQDVAAAPGTPGSGP